MIWASLISHHLPVPQAPLHEIWQPPWNTDSSPLPPSFAHIAPLLWHQPHLYTPCLTRVSFLLEIFMFCPPTHTYTSRLHLDTQALPKPPSLLSLCCNSWPKCISIENQALQGAGPCLLISPICLVPRTGPATQCLIANGPLLFLWPQYLAGKSPWYGSERHGYYAFSISLVWM